MFRNNVKILLVSVVLIGCSTPANHGDLSSNGQDRDKLNSSRLREGLSTPPLPQGGESNRISPLDRVTTDYVDNQDRNIGLIKASASGSLNDAKTFLEKGADPSFVIGDYSALHIAVLKNDLKMLTLLMPKASNIDIMRPSTGMTPLMEAAYYPRIECLTALLKAGASPSAQTQRGFTVLDISAETMRLSNKSSLIYNKSKKIHELLLKSGARSALRKL